MGRPAAIGVGLCYDRAMFRTRDFILLFSVITFLLMAIGTTLINQGRSGGDIEQISIQSENDVEYTATLVSAEGISRAQRVSQMRSKISQETLISEELVEEDLNENLVDSDASTTTDESLVESGAVLCPLYRSYTNFWDARDLSLIEVEGARVLVRGEISPTSIQESVIQLPIRLGPSGNPSCIPSDVIGIAKDGSLIRNDEAGLYSIFGSETLLGYALDGFPIHGVGAAATDACGGVLTAAGYRYELSAERDTAINCFAATPILLP
ncbi:MAG: hypothetical protein ACI9SY_000482 [Candidatus Paceibacteria bacterium]